MKKQYDYLLVGSGLFAGVFAYYAKKAGKTCLVLEKREHAGGNIYCENIEGINVHRYGAHIFHTSNKEVWNFVNSLVEFNRYTNSPVANYKGEMYNMPFNMNTFSRMWGISTPEEAKKIINEQRKVIKGEPKNLEEQAIITEKFQDITNNDMHVIEAIGIGTPKNMSSIAKKLSVTVGTLTIAMNSLVKKGYVKRERGEEDRRVVYISLSDKGKKAFVHHARFHKEMITSIMDEFDDDEKKILIRGLTKLDNWFKNKEEENKKNRE